MSPRITLDGGLELALGYLLLADCNQGGDDHALGAACAAAADEVRRRFADAALTDQPAVAGIRALFRAGGIDPARYRPSGEALARRLLRGDPLPRVNTLVDVNNLVSVTSLLPCGIYDRAALDGDIQVRRGREGESYAGISKSIALDGRLTSSDRQGPFGSPIADSRRTMVGATCNAALVLIYAPLALAERELRDALTHYAALAGRHAGATVEDRGVVIGAAT